MTATTETPEPSRSARYFVHAEHEPSVFARIVGLFVQRDLVPERASCVAVHRDGRDWLEIDIEAAGLEEMPARHLASRIEQLFPVISVAFDYSAVTFAAPRHRAA